MSAGVAAYHGSVETMQIIGDAQQEKSVQQVLITQQQQQQQLLSSAGAIHMVDGTTLVPTESLIISPQQQQPQTLHHHTHSQMATIVTSAGATPILVPTQPVGPIAVAIATVAPTGAPLLTSPSVPVIDYAQMNGTGGAQGGSNEVVVATSAEGAVVAGGEYYMQAPPLEGMIMAPVGVPVAATSDGTPIPFDQLKQLLQTQLEYYFSR